MFSLVPQLCCALRLLQHLLMLALVPKVLHPCPAALSPLPANGTFLSTRAKHLRPPSTRHVQVPVSTFTPMLRPLHVPGAALDKVPEGEGASSQSGALTRACSMAGAFASRRSSTRCASGAGYGPLETTPAA